MPRNAAPLKMRLWNPKTSTTISMSTGRRRTGTRKRSAWTGTKNRHAPSPASSELPQRFEPEGRNRLEEAAQLQRPHRIGDRKSTRLNSSHGYISYAVFCLKKKKKTK